MHHEVDMRWERVVPGKHVMKSLMISINEAEIKAEDI